MDAVQIWSTYFLSIVGQFNSFIFGKNKLRLCEYVLQISIISLTFSFAGSFFYMFAGQIDLIFIHFIFHSILNHCADKGKGGVVGGCCMDGNAWKNAEASKGRPMTFSSDSSLTTKTTRRACVFF